MKAHILLERTAFVLMTGSIIAMSIHTGGVALIVALIASCLLGAEVLKWVA